MPRIHNDAIILMHPTKPTVEALPQIIKQLREEGYQMVPVSLLISRQRTMGPGIADKNSHEDMAADGEYSQPAWHYPLYSGAPTDSLGHDMVFT